MWGLAILIGIDIGISIFNHLKLKQVMKKNEEVLAVVQELDEATNKVAAKLDKVVADLEAGKVDDATIASLRSVSSRLKTLGADPENPVPDAPVEPSDPIDSNV
jgi:hypothetical protein